MANRSAITERLRARPLAGIFLTVFLDLVGFGMFIPDLQLRGRMLSAQQLGPGAGREAIALLTGTTLAAFSLAQLLGAPYLGRLSDRSGRKRVLAVTTLLSTAAYLVYAHATSYPVVLLSRALSGVAAANLGVAFAYVADVTRPDDRARGMGAIGAAFGLGFILGPPLGGFLLKIGRDSPLVLGYVGAAMAAANFLYVVLLLPESAPAGSRSQTRFLADFAEAIRTPGLALMLAMFFAINLGFTNLETTFFQLLADSRAVFALDEDRAKQVGSLVLAFVGVVAAIMQGLVVRRVVGRFGESRLLRYAYFGYIPALALVPFAPLWLPQLLVQAVLGVSIGLANPSLSSLVSRAAPAHVRGGIFGVTQSLGALARTVGPLIAVPIFAWRPYAPYALGALILLFPAFAAWRLPAPVESGISSE